jgi:hypothetical protein
LETDDPDRRRAAWEDARQQVVYVNDAAVTSYLDFISENREALLSIATRRVAEMQVILATLPESVRANVPPHAWDDLVNMTPEEYAARMVAVPFTMNVPGWLNDYGRVGIDRAVQYFAPETAFATMAGIPVGNAQSAGYLELREDQFYQIVNTRAFSIGGQNYPISDSPLEMELMILSNPGLYGLGSLPSFITTRDENFEQYLAASLPQGSTDAFGGFGSSRAYVYSEAMLESGIPLANTVSEQVLGETMATRFLLQNLQYIDIWQNPDLANSWSARDAETFWHLVSPTTHAISASRAGWWSTNEVYGLPTGYDWVNNDVWKD